MNKYKHISKYFSLVIAIFIFVFFKHITELTPLAGDDWGYAVNTLNINPFMRANEFYFNWSGRYFSELWGFIVAPNRWLWDIINPILFTIIFICIYKLTKVKKNYIFIPLLILALILSIDNELRMETYTWIMGTTYIVPLTLSLIYYVVIDYMLFNEAFNKKHMIFIYIISNILLFYIGLTMENIAAIMILSSIILMVLYNKDYAHQKLFISNAIISIVSFTIMRMSPGSTYRLHNDNSEWLALGLFDKLANGYENFIKYTFIENRYLIIFTIIISVLLILFSKNEKSKMFITGNLIVQAIALVSTLMNFIDRESILCSPTSLFTKIFWIIYIISFLFIIYNCLEDNVKYRALFFFILAGSYNIVMLYSPIFGPRSSIYTIFYLILTLCIIINELEINKIIILGMTLVCAFISYLQSNEYYRMYDHIDYITSERQIEIDYYKQNPDAKEAWIIRYPERYLHGANVEPDDKYHLIKFKEYYGLPQDADNIIFYFKERK